jgi:hypothetical protein
MQARHFIAAMRAGDGLQLLRAASVEAGQLASQGGPEGKREQALVTMGRELAVRSGSTEREAYFEGGVGLNHFLRGRWRQAREQLEGARAKLRYGRAFWQTNQHAFSVNALYFLGSIRELRRSLEEVLGDARHRGDIFTQVMLAPTAAIATHLAADDPDGARRHLREAVAQWSPKGFYVQHWEAMIFEPEIELYVGDGGAAYDRFVRDMPALKGSLLTMVQFVRGVTAYSHGRFAIASIAARPAARAARIAETRRVARRLERERMPWTAPLAAMLHAMAASEAGDRTAAVEALRVAVDTAASAEMAMHATAARYRLGEMLGGAEGRDLLRAAREHMTEQGIRNPARWVSVYLPGRWEEPR